MQALWKDNLNLRLIAMATAITLWILVGRDQTTWILEAERTFTVAIQVRDPQGIAEGKKIVLNPSHAQIQVSGPRNVLSKLEPQQIEVYVNIKKQATKAWVVVAPPPEVAVVDVAPKQVSYLIVSQP